MPRVCACQSYCQKKLCWSSAQRALEIRALIFIAKSLEPFDSLLEQPSKFWSDGQMTGRGLKLDLCLISAALETNFHLIINFFLQEKATFLQLGNSTCFLQISAHYWVQGLGFGAEDLGFRI